MMQSVSHLYMVFHLMRSPFIAVLSKVHVAFED